MKGSQYNKTYKLEWDITSIWKMRKFQTGHEVVY